MFNLKQKERDENFALFYLMKNLETISIAYLKITLINTIKQPFSRLINKYEIELF